MDPYHAVRTTYLPLLNCAHEFPRPASTLFSATNKMQCTSKLGEMLSLSRNTQDRSDKTLMKMISIASGASSGAHLAALLGSKDLSASRCLGAPTLNIISVVLPHRDGADHDQNSPSRISRLMPLPAVYRRFLSYVTCG